MVQKVIRKWFCAGLGVGQNLEKALELCRSAAAQGDAAAKYCLGVLYSNGHGIDQNLTAARQYLLEAAEQGNPAAQNSLGKCTK